MAVPRAEYQCWWNMIDRCTNPKNKLYPLYGDRGIVVCWSWRCNFNNFITDMNCRPTPQHSIDRINNDGNYEPSNCRWATKQEQSNNSRPRYSSEGKERVPDRAALQIWLDGRLTADEAVDKINSIPGYELDWKRTTAYRQLGRRKLKTGPISGRK